MEKYNFKIAKIPKDFVNVSDAEGSTTINRYNITIPVIIFNINTFPLYGARFGKSYGVTFEFFEVVS